MHPPCQTPAAGEWWQATYYIISTVGSPFQLGLPFATAQLGWVAGLLILCMAYPAVVYTSRLTARLHEYKGTRHNRYRELGQAVWGEWCGVRRGRGVPQTGGRQDQHAFCSMHFASICASKDVAFPFVYAFPVRC